MSVLPPEPNWEDFENQLADLPVDLPDVTNVRTLTNDDLLGLFYKCNSELQTLHEEMVPRTDKGREVHSLRAAARVELAVRKLL